MSKPINGAKPTEWAKHLRPYGKRAFWKRHRALDYENPTQDDVNMLIAEHIERTTPKKKKRYGVKKTYAVSWMAKTFDVTDWYATERAQQEAIKAIMRLHSFRPSKIEAVMR